MSEHLVRSVLGDIPPSAIWQQWLRNLAVTLYRHQQKTQDIQRLIDEAQMDEAVLGDLSTALARGLTERGFRSDYAFEAQRSVMMLATSWTMMAVDPNRPDDAPEPGFMRSVDALIAGWELASKNA